RDETERTSTDSATERRRMGAKLTLAPLPRALLQHDRRADEAEVLAQSPLEEPKVARVQLAAGEQDECRRRDRGLGPEHDPGLLAAPDRVRVLGNQPAQERVEGARRDP